MEIPKEYKNLNKYGLTPKTIRNFIPNKDKIQGKPCQKFMTFLLLQEVLRQQLQTV